MGAAEFKVGRPAWMGEVAAQGDEMVITKYGRPVAKLAPYK